MAIPDWTGRRILWLVSGTEAFRAALFFDYILQLSWILSLLPIAALTYLLANAHLNDSSKAR